MTLAGCGGEGSALPPQALPALAPPVTVVRLPHDGTAPPTVYDLTTLAPDAWTFHGRLPPIRAVVGENPDERVLFVLDRSGDVQSIDLDAGTLRAPPPVQTARLAATGPDGAVYAVTAKGGVVQHARRRETVFRSRPVGRITHLFGTLNDQAVAVATSGDSTLLQVIGADRTGIARTIPAGTVAATVWGDALAIATRSEVTLYDPSDQRPPRPLEDTEGIRALLFSPSGHRLYLAGEKPSLRLVDRYTGTPRGTIPLPGTARALRVDFSGRWLLAAPASGDSAWVVDLAAGRRIATLMSAWSEDLPVVAGAGTALLRDGDDVVAVDLQAAPPRETGRIANGAADLWTVARWVPREDRPVALAAAETALVAQDSALLVPETTSDAPAVQIFLQVSSSQNPTWAGALAKQLGALGFPASVLPPDTPDQGHRVVVGPYPSREVAETEAKRLGRPYFILTRSITRP